MNIKYTKAVVLATAAGFFATEVCGFGSSVDPLDPRANVPSKYKPDGTCKYFNDADGFCYHSKRMVKQCKNTYKKCRGSGSALNANCNTYDNLVRDEICPPAPQAAGSSDFCPELNTAGAEFTERASCGDAPNEADCLKTYVVTGDWYAGCSFKAGTCSEETAVVKDVTYTVVQKCAEVCTVNLGDYFMLTAPDKCGQGNAVVSNTAHNLAERLTKKEICESTLVNYVAFGVKSDVKCTWDDGPGCNEGEGCRCRNTDACMPVPQMCCLGDNCKECDKRAKE